MIFFFFLLSFGGTKMKQEPQKKLTVASSAFEHEAMIPPKYTCDAENISPEISWEGAPEETKSFVLISDDPDAPMGTWVHWVVYNIPPEITKLPEAVPAKDILDNGTKQGISSFRSIGYGGPCPPSGTHRYFFKVYAVDITLDLKPKDATKEKVLKAIEEHILAYGELMGKYKRQ